MSKTSVYKSLHITLDPKDNIIIGPTGIFDSRQQKINQIDNDIRKAEDKLDELNSSIDIKKKELEQLEKEKIEELQQKKIEILKEAEEERNQLLEQVKTEIEICKKDSFQKGYDEGYRYGLNEVNEKTEGFINSFNSILNEMQAVKEETLLKSKEDIAEIVGLITREIIKKELTVSPAKITLNNITSIIKEISKTKKVVIKVHPEIAVKIEKIKNKLKAKLSGVEDLTIYGDNSIAKGGCIIETDYGNIDARIKTQIARSINILRNEI